MDHASDLTPHAYDTVETMSMEERVMFGVRHGMSQIGAWPYEHQVKNESRVVDVCADLMSLSMKPIVGWTKGVQWVVYGSGANIRMFIGTKRFSFFVTGLPSSMVARIYADDNIFPTISLMIEDIRDDIIAQRNRLRESPKFIADFALAKAELNAETFPSWARNLSKEAREDPLHQVLFEKYHAEFNAAEAGYFERMRKAFFHQCRARGARYVSVGQSLFCVLEDVRTDGVAGKSVVHQIAEDLNFYAGDYESFGVKTMNLFVFFGRDIQGIWRVDGDEPVHVRPHPVVENNRGYRNGHRSILRGLGVMDEAEWLDRCGAVEQTSRY